MKTYVYSIIVCAFICGIFTQMTAGTKHKKLMHLISGTVLAVTLLLPLSRITEKSWARAMPDNSISAEYYIAEGKKEAMNARIARIEDACESYIFDKVKSIDADLTFRFTLNEKLVPAFVEVEGPAEPNLQRQLQTILEADLGIPEENQKWILHPENSSS